MTISRSDTSKGRFYTIEGSKYPSVTTILGCIGKPALINWAANTERAAVIEAAADLYEDAPTGKGIPRMMRAVYVETLKGRLGKVKAHTKELAKAGDIGTQVHSLIEWNIRKSLGQEPGPEPRLAQGAQQPFATWQEWASCVKFKPLLCEQTVFSTEHQYAGTMDLLAEMELQGTMTTVLVDWKTGKAIYDEALLQNAAYIHALIEMEQVKPPISGLIVRLPKTAQDPEVETRVIPYVEHEKLFRVFKHVRALWGWQAGNGYAEH
jgi:hypothetical protein